MAGQDPAPPGTPTLRRTTRTRDPTITENHVTAALRQVCLDLSEQLGLLGATITVMAPQADASVAASSPPVQAWAELQFTLGEGPSIDSFASRRPVLVPDLAASDGRWVGFTPSAVAMGLGGVYAFPLGLGATQLGVFTCYAGGGHVLEASDLSRCLVAADLAAVILLDREDSEREDGAVLADATVQASLHIRTEVYQAQGMLMVELGVSLSDAMARLRAVAFTENIDLNQLAAELVSGRRPFPPKDPVQALPDDEPGRE